MPKVWLALVLAILIGAGFLLDAPVFRWVAERQGTPWKAAAQFVTHGGDWPALALTAVLAMLLARVFRARRWMTLLCVMFVATLLAGAAVQPMRVITGRARPNSEAAPGWYGMRKDGKWILGRHRFCAFPSAHTTVAAAFVTPLIVIGGMRWLPIWLFAVAVGLSRIYLGAHHPSDVMVGLILGSGCGWLVSRSPRLRWWAWRFSSVLCGFRRLPKGAGRRAAILLGGTSI